MNHRPRPSQGATRPRRQALRRLATWGILLFLAASVHAYTVFLRDGTTFLAQGPYEVEGDQAVITLMSGTQTTVDLSEIDIERTRTANQRNLSDAVVIDESGTRQFEIGEGRAASAETLRERIQRRSMLGVEAGDRLGGGSQELPRTYAGFPDFAAMIRRPLESAQQETEITTLLREQGIDAFRLYQGSAPETLFVEVSTQSRADVFQQLEALSRAWEPLVASIDLEAMEILMMDAQRGRAGQFVLSATNVGLLNNGLISPQEFFLQFVQF